MHLRTSPVYYWYHYDGLGSVVALSNSSGSIVEKYSYDAFGSTSVTLNGDTGNPYMYTGRRFDSESGLYYYRARMYWPGLGRFLQPDPIGYTDGMNMYTYVGNNPLNFVDPWGLWGTSLDKDPATVVWYREMTSKTTETVGHVVRYEIRRQGRKIITKEGAKLANMAIRASTVGKQVGVYVLVTAVATGTAGPALQIYIEENRLSRTVEADELEALMKADPSSPNIRVKVGNDEIILSKKDIKEKTIQ